MRFISHGALVVFKPISIRTHTIPEDDCMRIFAKTREFVIPTGARHERSGGILPFNSHSKDSSTPLVPRSGRNDKL